MEELQHKITYGIEFLHSYLEDCCSQNQHEYKRFTAHDTATCPPHGKVCLNIYSSSSIIFV